MSDQRFYNEQEAEEILRLASRDVSVEGMTRERLMQTAAELGITPEAIQRAEDQMVKKREADRIAQEEAELRKEYRQSRRQSFLKDLSTYVTINLGLVALWWFSKVGYFWPGWVIGGWGIGVLSDFYQTYFAPDDEAKFRRWLRRRNRKMGSAEMIKRAEPILNEFYAANPGETMDAVNEIHVKLGVDLRDAKDVVEAYEARKRKEGNHTGLQARLEHSEASDR